MYKQTFFAVVSILLSLPMAANAGIASPVNTQDLNAKVTREAAFQQRNSNYVEWVKALKQEERKVNRPGYMGFTSYGMFTTTYMQHPVTKDQNLYKQRVNMIQAQLNNHPVLNGYALYVPVPEMLTNLTLEELNFLYSFLEQSVEISQFDRVFEPTVSKPEKAVVEVTIDAVYNTKLILRMDAAKKRVYFFKDAVTK